MALELSEEFCFTPLLKKLDNILRAAEGLTDAQRSALFAELKDALFPVHDIIAMPTKLADEENAELRRAFEKAYTGPRPLAMRAKPVVTWAEADVPQIVEVRP
jgi:hypothetical protein